MERIIKKCLGRLRKASLRVYQIKAGFSNSYGSMVFPMAHLSIHPNPDSQALFQDGELSFTTAERRKRRDRILQA